MIKKIGFIGVGNMGYGMVKNLLEKGFSIFAYDIDSKKLNAVKKLGAKISKNIKEVADMETAILCLPHPDISKKTILTLLQGKVRTIIETSTLTPEDSSSFKKLVEKNNVEYLCAPMLAGKQMAMEGTIHFIVEGKRTVFEKNKILFEAMGKTTFTGAVPSATLTKLSYNICRYSNVATALTVIDFLKQYSKDLKPIYEILTEGSLDNFGQVWKQEMGEVAIQNKPYKFAGSKVPIKDLSLIIKLAKNKELKDELLKEIKNIYQLL